MPIGRTPGDLSRAISLLAFNAHMSSHGTRVLAHLLGRAATASRRESMALLNFSNMDCHC